MGNSVKNHFSVIWETICQHQNVEVVEMQPVLKNHFKNQMTGNYCGCWGKVFHFPHSQRSCPALRSQGFQVHVPQCSHQETWCTRHYTHHMDIGTWYTLYFHFEEQIFTITPTFIHTETGNLNPLIFIVLKNPRVMEPDLRKVLRHSYRIPTVINQSGSVSLTKSQFN